MDDEHLYTTLFEDEITLLEEKIDNWPIKKDLMVFYGSSSFRLWENIGKDLLPLNIMNLGFGGASFGLCVRHYDRLFKRIRQPRHIVFYGGDNDLDNGLPPETIMKQFKKLLAMTRKDFPQTPISVVTIKPSPSRTYLQPKIKLTNDLIRKELLKLGKADQINTFDSMLDANGVARPELFIEDQLHMNEKGYQIWKGVIRKHFGI